MNYQLNESSQITISVMRWFQTGDRNFYNPINPIEVVAICSVLFILSSEHEVLDFVIKLLSIRVEYRFSFDRK